jgi:DnaJ-class molecular chaperone
MSDKVICKTCKGDGRIDGLISQHDDKTENVPCPNCDGRDSFYQMTEQEERDYWEDYW